MKKTIGLAIVTYKDNFGSALQSYATQKAVQKLGFHTEVLQISGVSKAIQKKKVLFYLKRLFAKDELKYVFSKAVSKFKNENTGSYAENMRVRHGMYQKFNNQYFNFAPVKGSWKELSDLCNSYDGVLVGSDQLWRPSNIAGCYFTLEFVPEKIRKIAYSTSFGVSVLPKSQCQHAKTFLQRMDFISVREDTGAALVKNLIDREAPVVCDPTMLFSAEEWMEIQPSSRTAQGEYILCYFMGENSMHREFAQRLKQATGYKLVALLHGSTYIASDETFADEAPYDVGPGEFVELIRNAQYVCTDSFHGTVFSIINQTPFFDFRRYDDQSAFSTNDRLHTLLKWTGLSERMLNGDENVDDCLAMKIDFSKVLERVDENRKQSMEYLKGALHFMDCKEEK